MKMYNFFVVVMNILLYCCDASSSTNSPNQRSTFIVQMHKDDMPTTFISHLQWYDASLKSVSDYARTVYTYDHVIHGFAASLTAKEVELLEKKPGVTRVHREVIYKVQTTRTPTFLGINDESKAFTPILRNESEVIIGVIDTGIWPESQSFIDNGLPPVPKRWKGGCDVIGNFTKSSCNRKLIGARFYLSGYEDFYGPLDEKKDFKSPRDSDGHGTHTASTAAGSIVHNASLYGYAQGTAQGMATRARVAAYKVCWSGGCVSSDILAAMDTAVADGVDILSISIGAEYEFDYGYDLISIGAFAATTEKGILVSCAAGNNGPLLASVTNTSPWMTTVGAGTLDRNFPVLVTLGNGSRFSGVSTYGGESRAKSLTPLIYASDASNSNNSLCKIGSLIPEKVKGKIVICDRGVNPRVEKSLVVKLAGGIGMVLANAAENGQELVADAHFLPTAAVGFNDGLSIKNYLRSNSNPTAMLSDGKTVIGVEPSPVVAAFSSRGPNNVVDILKPDLIAPGVNILAAWTGAVGPSSLLSDERRVNFNIISGTSMSCPHLSGIAAFLKAAHPGWSPAAIRSALMTTASTTYKATGKPILDAATGHPATPFDFGAGQVNPSKALDPGLIYDITPDDYKDFLCAMKYNDAEVKAFVRSNNFACQYGTKKYSVANLNYPSFAASFPIGASRSLEFTRTLTNVGVPATRYTVSVSSPSSINVSVTPNSLFFNKQQDMRSYKVRFSGNPLPWLTTVFGYLQWKDNKNHTVTSQFAITWT